MARDRFHEHCKWEQRQLYWKIAIFQFKAVQGVLFLSLLLCSAVTVSPSTSV